MTLLGLTSRWSLPSACSASSAAMSPEASASNVSRPTPRGERASRAASVSPSMSSIVKKLVAPTETRS
jgi:hypothetical protein